jgi:hypothetical protein
VTLLPFFRNVYYISLDNYGRSVMETAATEGWIDMVEYLSQLAIDNAIRTDVKGK